MIVAETYGNILKDPAQTLVCPVNTVGVMGKGLALDFKTMYPDMYAPYQWACRVEVFRRQGFYVYNHSKERKILCLPTKRHFKFRSKIEWVDYGLEKIAETYEEYGITSLAIPAVGCGEGRLSWDDVYPLIKHHLGRIALPVTVYLPS